MRLMILARCSSTMGGSHSLQNGTAERRKGKTAFPECPEFSFIADVFFESRCRDILLQEGPFGVGVRRGVTISVRHSCSALPNHDCSAVSSKSTASPRKTRSNHRKAESFLQANESRTGIFGTGFMNWFWNRHFLMELHRTPQKPFPGRTVRTNSRFKSRSCSNCPQHEPQPKRSAVALEKGISCCVFVQQLEFGVDVRNIHSGSF